ncbi:MULTISPECIES: ABC transporter permease [unclassified Chelatococcus]|uniref:ABC transporter permease n=1 Tax=unclassified Chelatococcus TaxID=2638111 RepID=UPI001BD0B665|nr:MULTISPECIES: ABC transporter permease [unclassified Chelatococcus]MBS7699129.1 ABC transporter permease [Chelatococcus sp. YT9]MBX3554910.1 ABC transporter permease [Chelatococcus sp.]
MIRRLSRLDTTVLTLGFVFLYLPLVVLVIYSFNGSQLVAVWGGFSTRWYSEVWANSQLIDALWTSVGVALVSASLATVLGTFAALALVRHGRFRGRTLFTGMIYAPLVMPEVITGLALLLFFVSLDIGRGFWTVTLAHTSFTMSFVAVVVQSRLIAFDRSLEEAALDLGSPPLRTFFKVTLPLIAPSVGAGFLLALTLSLDDVVIASFTTGPGTSTLPIEIFNKARRGLSPEINALCTLMLLAVTVLVIASSLVTKARNGDAAAL